MIIGGSKKAVIKNIKKNIKNEEYNKKAEVNDPNLDEELLVKLVNNFYVNKNKKISYLFKNKTASVITAFFGHKLYKNINIHNIELLKKEDLSKGAIITCNHFNPLDSYCVRKIAKKLHKRVYILVQATNLAMPKFLGFLMNNMDTIPLLASPHYIIDTLKPTMQEILNKGDFILI